MEWMNISITVSFIFCLGPADSNTSSIPIIPSISNTTIFQFPKTKLFLLVDLLNELKIIKIIKKNIEFFYYMFIIGFIANQ